MISMLRNIFYRLAIRPIRYLMLKIMKRFAQSDDGRPAIAVSNHLLEEMLLPASFDIFKDEKFRQLADFDKLPQAEHDRIFNELVAAAILLAFFGLEHSDEITKPEYFHFWRKVRDQLPKQFRRSLHQYGAASENIRQYDQLIELRYEEYNKLKNQALDVWNKEQPKGLESFPQFGRVVASWVEATAFGTADHIKRGKLKSKDPLISFIVREFFSLNERIGRFVRYL